MATTRRDHKVADPTLARDLATVNAHAAMPTNAAAVKGYFETQLVNAGFVDVRVHGDYSENVEPMLRLFAWLAVVPLLLVRLLGAERRFVNTLAGARGYEGRKLWRYVAVTARKPGAVAASTADDAAANRREMPRPSEDPTPRE